MMQKKILIIIRQAPFASTLPNAAMDIVLTAAAFEQELSLLFLGAGVLHLLPGQNSFETGIKSISQALPSLELYDVKRVLFEENALVQRGFKTNQLLMLSEALSRQQILKEIEQADLVFNF